MTELCRRIARLALPLLACTAFADPPSPPPEAVAAGSDRLVFAEDFVQFDVSPDLSGTHRWFQMPSLGRKVSPDHWRVANGVIRLTTPADTRHGANTTFATWARKPGGGSATRFRYGYFEAELRYPAPDANGPAFWLGSETGILTPRPPGAHWCEIDVIEAFNSHSFQAAGIDWTEKKHIMSRPTLVPLPAGVDMTKWNRFGLLWQPTKLTWFINGEPVAFSPTPPPCRGEKLFVIFGVSKLSNGTDRTADFRSIRVWQ